MSNNPLLKAIRQGDQHRGVRVLQQAMNDRLGERLLVDGDYGPGTAEAVGRWQFNNRLTISGDAEYDLIAFLKLNLAPTAITKADIKRVADSLKVSQAKIMSIMKTEVNWPKKSGFLPDGRPIILFERHYFRRLLNVESPAMCAEVSSKHPNICNAKRGGYLGNAREYDRMDIASAYSPAVALQSASWGLFQIMGSHWQALGYPSIFHMVRACAASEGDHIVMLEKFIRANPRIHRGLLAGDWAAVALGYNGPAYKENQYDVKMANNFRYFASRGFD